MIVKLFTQVKERLESRLPDLVVEAYPIPPDAYHLNHPLGAILLRYQGAEYSDNYATDGVMQTRSLQFSCVLVTRRLDGGNGAYAMLEQVRRSLIGYGFDQFAPIQGVAERFIRYTDGIWHYAIDFRSEVQSIGAANPPALIAPQSSPQP